MLLAASTQRTVGLVILAIVFLGGLVFIYFNIRSARDEVGSEIELASNRKPYLSDEELEGKKLDLALGSSLVLLTIVAVTLPLYWLGEPGRHEGRDLDTWRIFNNRGEEIYIEGAQCVSCHGAEGAGGVVNTAITSESGEFVAQVNWKAPALNTLMSRHTEDEILHVLNFGRNGVMPAWGGGGGGPLTDQQLEEVIFYLRSVQLSEEQIREEVSNGVDAGAEDLIVASSDEAWAVELREATQAKDDTAWAVRFLSREQGFGFECSDQFEECVADEEAGARLTTATQDAQEPLAAALADWYDDVARARGTAEAMALEAEPSLGDEGNEDALRFATLEILSTPDAFDGQEAYLQWGEILFANTAANGTYSCARCHTYGWSFDGASNFTVEDNGRDGPIPELADGYVQGGGFFGPNLSGDSLRDQFETAGSQADFIERGQAIGQTYGRGGSGGNGQMPGFGPLTESNPVGPGMGPGSGVEFSYPALLTEAQIDAIVAFERTL
ncbi:MAG: cytochrome c [Actinomycetota bacterium]